MRFLPSSRHPRARPASPLARRGRAAALAAALAIGAPALAAETGSPIREPHYGDTLFHFFQDHYFTAVTTLMVSQHFGRVALHADEAEVLRGGMLLSYGLQREAGEIFARLIDKGAPPAVRDRAWFYLAKIRYQRGYPTEAEQALARVERRLPGELEEERALLQAMLLMARADFAAAASALDGVGGKTPGARYVRYNLGIALVKAGESARGSAVLDELGRQPAENEEYRSLRDRANVALGYAALTDNEPRTARGYLERVRLKSLHANKALLGFGWAAASLKEHKLALVPWLELAEREVSDSAALEARIAVPYAYAELGAYAQSLERYQAAIGAFEKENADLAQSIAAIRSGRWIDALIERNPGDELGWRWNIADLPELPHDRHLAQVMAQHEFQEAFKNYRDLRFLTRNLDEWRDKLGVFDDMLATRKKAFADRLPQVLARAGASGQEALRQRRDAVAAEVAGGAVADDGVAFADRRQVELLERVKGMRALLEGAPADAELAAIRDRFRLASGVLTWQLAQDQPGRAWEASKELQRIDAQMVEVQRRDAALVEAQRDEPARFERFGGRIAALSPLLQVMMPRVAALGREQQRAVQDIAVAELARQRERLVAYTTQARFAVAQLVDRAYGKQEAGVAAARPSP